MLVPKEDIAIQEKKLKKFKKLSLKLYQKEYRFHQNEFVLLNRTTNTNVNLISSIGEKILPPNEGDPKFKGLLAQVAINAKANQATPTFLKQYDFNYNHNLNFPLNENISLHIEGNLSSKNEYGLYSLNSSVSYHTKDYYYRVGTKLGPQVDCYMMALKKWNENISTGILVSFMGKEKFYKDKFVASLRYRNILAYASMGNQNLIGIKAYPSFDEKLKLYLNPYIGMGQKGFVTGLSRRLTNESSWKLELTFTEWLWALKSIMILKLNKAIKLFLEYEIQNTTLNINAGVKIKQFYLGLPLFSFSALKKDDLAWVAGFGFLFLGIGLLWDKIRANYVPKDEHIYGEKPLTLEQRKEKRQKDLGLIARRVKESYEYEKRIKGLLIIEAYYGPKEYIAKLIAIPPIERMAALMKEPYDEKIVNVLDSIRFYVENSRLKLPKKSKTLLFGIYEPPHDSNDMLVLYIRYSIEGVEAEKIVHDTQEVNLP